MARRILIVSPIPSHPQDQGNAARIHALARLLQSAGFVVHFLYWQMEGLEPWQRADMEACWDHLHPIPCSTRSMAPTGPGSFRLDDWYDPRVSEEARALHRRWRFAAVLANYIWFSGVLDALDHDVVKLLDTHDVFGGRDQRMLAAGLQPEWYYTTVEEEAAGLARADIVLAIQDEEAAHFRALGHSDVRVIGHILGQRFRHIRRAANGPARVGYLGSGNPLNVRSFTQMQARLAEAGGAGGMAGAGAGGHAYVVAGSICAKLPPDSAPFAVMGRVDHVDSFYDVVDLVVNPMTLGTGLKIKSVEAVFEGVPLLATESAMIGLPARHKLHQLGTPEDVADHLAGAALDPAALQDLAAASRACAAAYAGQVRAGVLGLAREIAGGHIEPASV